MKKSRKLLSLLLCVLLLVSLFPTAVLAEAAEADTAPEEGLQWEEDLEPVVFGEETEEEEIPEATLVVEPQEDASELPEGIDEGADTSAPEQEELPPDKPNSEEPELTEEGQETPANRPEGETSADTDPEGEAPPTEGEEPAPEENAEPAGEEDTGEEEAEEDEEEVTVADTGTDDGLINGIQPSNGGYVWLGGNKWRVIGQGAASWLLISDSVLGGTMTWESAKNYCNTVYTGFSLPEQAAVLATTKTDSPFEYYNGDYTKTYDATGLDGEELFLLSVKEAVTYFGTNSERAAPNYGEWWLRSPVRDNFYTGVVLDAGFVIFFGAVCYDSVNDDHSGSRPAFQLNLSSDLFSSVLFFSAAAGGKSSAAAGGGEFGALTGGSERKLTLIDSSRPNVNATVGGRTDVKAAPGGTLPLSYSGAKTGPKDYVSALLCDAGGTVLYYASLKPADNGSGTWQLALPGDLTVGSTYTLKVFSEELNGDNQTDYAGPVTEIKLTAAESEWTALQAKINAGGTVTLDRDYTLLSTDTPLTIPAGTTVTLNLNGRTINRDLSSAVENGNLITNNGSLTINGPGTLTGGNNTGSGGAIYNSGTLNIQGGSFTGNTAKEAGAVFNANGATLNISGGEFTDNTVTTFGGGAVVNYGTMTFSGGTISGHSVPGNGGGIWSRGTLTVSGGTITGNTSNGTGGGINLNGGSIGMSGNPVIMDNSPSSVYLPNRRTISVTGALESGARISVTTATAPTAGHPVVITSGLSGRGTAENFASDNPDFKVMVNAQGEAELRMTHGVKISSGIENGTVTADKSRAAEGESVTLTATPAEGYWLRELKALSGGVTVTDGKFTMGTADVEITAVFEKIPDFSVSLEQDYLLLRKNETAPVLFKVEPASWTSELTWHMEDENGVSTGLAVTVDAGGKVTAQSGAKGTFWAVAELKLGETVYAEARCRVDVLDETVQGETGITASLPVTQVTSELHRTEYTRFDVVLRLEQNLVTVADTMTAPDAQTNNGFSIEKAEFVGNDNNAKQDIRLYFDLRVVDDRTLEIVPKDSVAKDPAAAKAVAGSYKSTVTLTLSDGSEVTTENLLTVKVGKTLPKLKAAPVKLNRFIEGQEVPVVVTGGRVSCVTDCVPDQKVSAIASLDTDSLTVRANPENTKNGSGKFTLTCELADWAVPAQVTVSVSSAYTAPKLSFKPSSVTLSQDVMDSAAADYTLVALPGVEHQITGFKVYEKNREVTDSGLVMDAVSLPGTVFLYLDPMRETDGLKHSYKVYPLIDGKEVAALTLNVLARGSSPALVAKATGTIDLGINGSAVTVTRTGKNCNGLTYSGSKLTITQMKGKDVITEDAEAAGLFRVKYPEGFMNAYVITGTALLKDYVKGYTYKASITADMGLPEELTSNEVTLKVKDSSAKPPARSVTLKAKGSIDVLRPGTEVVLTPTFKNWFDYDEAKLGLRLNNPNLDWRQEDGKFVVFARGGADVDLSLKQAWLTYEGEDVSKPVNLSLKMGKAKVLQSTKTVTLSKNDRYDRQSVVLSLNDSALYDIGTARVELADKTGRLTLIPMGGGEYAIGYKDNLLPQDIGKLKSQTVKLVVFLQGNATYGAAKPKPNASISVTVKFG